MRSPYLRVVQEKTKEEQALLAQQREEEALLFQQRERERLLVKNLPDDLSNPSYICTADDILHYASITAILSERDLFLIEEHLKTNNYADTDNFMTLLRGHCDIRSHPLFPEPSPSSPSAKTSKTCPPKCTIL